MRKIIYVIENTDAAKGSLLRMGKLTTEHQFLGISLAGLLTLYPAISISTPNPSPDSPSWLAGWYLSAGLGASWMLDTDQKGSNKDPACYPTSTCSFATDAENLGYRWRYDIKADIGPAFGVSVGHAFDRVRLELSWSHLENDLDQHFLSVTPTGSGRQVMDDPEWDGVHTSHAGIGDMIVDTLTVDAYYDLPWTYRRFSPYLGAGVGVAFAEVENVKYFSQYQGGSKPDAASYNNRQNGDFNDTDLVWRVHAGVDYKLNDAMWLGLKVTYANMGYVEDRGHYDLHKQHERDANFTNRDGFGRPEHFTLMTTARYRFGD